MKKVVIILALILCLAFLFSTALGIERVPKKDTVASKEQKEEVKPSSEKKGEAIPERELKKPEPGIGTEQPREGELKKPERQKEEGIFRILRGSRKGLKEEGKDKYDYFIDKNGNGIDDRLEQQNKPEKKPEERKTPPPEKKERRGR